MSVVAKSVSQNKLITPTKEATPIHLRSNILMLLPLVLAILNVLNAREEYI